MLFNPQQTQEVRMIRTVEAVIDERRSIRLLESVHVSCPGRALVTILDEGPAASVTETTLLSEAVLAGDWSRLAEDVAWSHLARRGR
jgi:hypothetical protein